MLALSSLLLLLTPFSVLARPTLSPRDTRSTQLIYQFSDFTLENLAPRSNGHLLLTATNQPYLCDIDPNASSPSPTYLPELSNVTSVLGIAETSSDVFAVAAGSFSGFTATPGSFSVWSVNMNTPQPTVKLITAIPQAGLLNGAAALNGFTGSILIADSVLGAIWKVDVNTGSASIVIQNDAFNNDPSNPASFGINGLRMSGGFVYFTNSFQGTYGRIPVHGDGSAAGDVEILARTTEADYTYDDFDRDSAQTAWIGTHPDHVSEVTAAGTQTEITGDPVAFFHPTSMRFGRGAQQGTLYVVNSGDNTVSGKIVAMST